MCHYSPNPSLCSPKNAPGDGLAHGVVARADGGPHEVEGGAEGLVAEGLGGVDDVLPVAAHHNEAACAYLLLAWIEGVELSGLCFVTSQTHYINPFISIQRTVAVVRDGLGEHLARAEVAGDDGQPLAVPDRDAAPRRPVLARAARSQALSCNNGGGGDGG